MGNREALKKPLTAASKDTPSFSTPYPSAPECLRGGLRSHLSDRRKEISSRYESGEITFTQAINLFKDEIERLKKEYPNIDHVAAWQISEFLKYANTESEKALVNQLRTEYSSTLDQATKDKLDEKYGKVVPPSPSLDQKSSSTPLISQPEPIVFSQTPSEVPSVSWDSYDRPKEPTAFEVTIIAPSVAAVMFLVEKASDLVDLLAGQRSPRTTSTSSDFDHETTLIIPQNSDKEVQKTESLKNEFSSPDSKIEPMAEMPLAVSSSPIETEKVVSAPIIADLETAPKIMAESLIDNSPPRISQDTPEVTNTPDQKSRAAIRSKIAPASSTLIQGTDPEPFKPKKLGFFAIAQRPRAVIDSALAPKQTPRIKVIKSKSSKKPKEQNSKPHPKSKALKKPIEATKKIDSSKKSAALMIKKSPPKNPKTQLVPLSKTPSNEKQKVSILKTQLVSKVASSKKSASLRVGDPTKSKLKDDSNSLIKSKIIKTKKRISKRIKKEEKKDKFLLKKEKEKFRAKLELLIKSRSSNKTKSKRSK